MLVVDFRPPNVIRACPSPLYTSFKDVYRVVEEFVGVLEEGEYEGIEPEDADVT